MDGLNSELHLNREIPSELARGRHRAPHPGDQYTCKQLSYKHAAHRYGCQLWLETLGMNPVYGMNSELPLNERSRWRFIPDR